MGNFAEHINHSKSNLDFLQKINCSVNDRWDWQVTTCFYSALHMINAHVVDKTKKNYLSHNQVANMINPFEPLSVSKLDSDTYASYIKLFHLSRRSRYLLNENFKKGGSEEIQPISSTYSKHFQKSIYHLDKIMEFINKEYKVSFEIIKLDCIDIKGKEYKYFSHMN